MYRALPRANMVRELRLRTSSYTIFSNGGPKAKEPAVPITPTKMTTCMSRRNPLRNSTRSPCAASRASRGSNAACTAWNRNNGTRDSRTPLPKAVTNSDCSLVAKILIAMGPALTRPAPINEPSSSQPRFGVTSLHGATGPGVVLISPRNQTTSTPERGERAISIAYAPTLVMPICQNRMHPTIRTNPSAPMTIPYEANRPCPEQIPRARWVGA